ncbi:hypothetical protein RHRU231_820165 [Rhodococcus ruber]|uniref:Uncharacterized protein n=1 Tax=Rhodococcus ruber TaxID=1830 RepID=A0A098BT53_9NOCA|nr:hypothetical protein RHRU231_820165 [Rhodococcus ruber]
MPATREVLIVTVTDRARGRHPALVSLVDTRFDRPIERSLCGATQA